MYCPALHCGVYCKAVRPETACIMHVLTFLYISFSKKICQKKVKKNCKYAARVFFKNADMRRE